MKIRALCPISGSNDSLKKHEMRLISKLGTLHPLGINELLVTFNAHLLCLTNSLIDSPSFLFFYPILLCVFVSLSGIILCNTIYISLFTICFDEIHLIGFYFVEWCFCINSYKNTCGFPRPPTTNSRRRDFAQNVDFSFIVSGSARTFTFRDTNMTLIKMQILKHRNCVEMATNCIQLFSTLVLAVFTIKLYVICFDPSWPFICGCGYRYIHAGKWWVRD